MNKNASGTRQIARAIWVVEVYEGNGRWRSSEWVGLTREMARDQMRDWLAESCVDRLRVAKYGPAA